MTVGLRLSPVILNIVFKTWCRKLFTDNRFATYASLVILVMRMEGADAELQQLTEMLDKAAAWCGFEIGSEKRKILVNSIEQKIIHQYKDEQSTNAAIIGPVQTLGIRTYITPVKIAKIRKSQSNSVITSHQSNKHTRFARMIKFFQLCSCQYCFSRMRELDADDRWQGAVPSRWK